MFSIVIVEDDLIKGVELEDGTKIFSKLPSGASPLMYALQSDTVV